jgi:hypothetical protein
MCIIDYKILKKELFKNNSVHNVPEEPEDDEEQSKILEWSDIDVNKIIMRSNSHGNISDVHVNHPKKPKKLSTFIERISPYLPDYLLQKFLEN